MFIVFSNDIPASTKDAGEGAGGVWLGHTSSRFAKDFLASVQRLTKEMHTVELKIRIHAATLWWPDMCATGSDPQGPVRLAAVTHP